MYVFRDGRYAVRGSELVRALLAEVRLLPSEAPGNSCLNALLRAGELECALADSGAAPAGQLALLQAVTEITDWLALGFAGQGFVENQKNCDVENSLRVLQSVSTPETLYLTRPEGFAYYALHPRDYALAASQLSNARAVAVMGIRSIGSTLSAVTAAALRVRGCRASRITVRPGGDPFNRVTIFRREELDWIANNLAAKAEFVVVDEGPGLSGSSFLSVGEALVEAGVPRCDITFLCARLPDPETLRSRDGARRWRSFKSMAVASSQQRPPEVEEWVGAGEWRGKFSAGERLASVNHPAASESAIESNWPASWTQMERAKFLSRDQRTLYKFEGLGHYGAAVVERGRILARRGFAPAIVDHDLSSGYVRYELIRARPMAASDVSPEVLERMAGYLALRGEEFSQSQIPESSSPPAQDEISLTEMCQVNARKEFGIELPPPSFESHRRVIADGRMLPHEWLRTTSGELLKTDGASHGDDHFFPGTCDIAWDLAGAIVEWELSAAAAEFFLQRYHHISGDDARPRLASYRLAYSLFRMGYCKMAAEAMQGSPEEIRLQSAYRYYRRIAEHQLSQRAAA